MLAVERQLCDSRQYACVCHVINTKMAAPMAVHVDHEVHQKTLACGLIFLALVRRRQKERKRRQQRQPTMPYVIRRPVLGAFHSLLHEMREDDPKQLKRFLRMSGETFDQLIHLVGPVIERQDTCYKDSIPPEERLAVTLRYLAEGGPYINMFYLFRIPESTLGYMIPDVCDAIYNVLKDQYLKQPSTREDWISIQEEFLKRWHFPQYLGALDGKHVRIRCPANAGSAYYNYLGYHSVVLFALVDAKYKFLYYEVGAPGRVGDATIWNKSPLKAALEDNTVALPDPRTTPGSNTPIPSLIVADSAFALSSRLMKPYPDRGSTREHRVFNYRLSRARRIVENAFGILASRFGVYQRALQVKPKTVRSIIMATIALHNFLREVKDQQYAGPRTVDAEMGENRELVLGDWRNNQNANLDGLQPVVGGIRGNRRAEIVTGVEIRNTLCNYFVGEGAVPWQNRIR